MVHLTSGDYPETWENDLILFNKPYGVLSRCTTGRPVAGLCDHFGQRVSRGRQAGRRQRGIAAAHRRWGAAGAIAIPSTNSKTYWAQVGAPRRADLEPLRSRVRIFRFCGRPAKVRVIAEPPGLWPRDP